MSELSVARIWGMRLVFVAVVFFILFFHLLPLDMTPNAWVSPDLLLCLSLAWSVRRPEFVPLTILAGVFLLADLLFQRPPGLWAACALLACDRLKVRNAAVREVGFASEWLGAAVAIVLVAMTYRFGLIITFLPLPSFGLVLLELVLTILAYPLVAGATHWALGVRRPSPGDLDAIGGKL